MSSYRHSPVNRRSQNHSWRWFSPMLMTTVLLTVQAQQQQKQQQSSPSTYPLLRKQLGTSSSSTTGEFTSSSSSRSNNNNNDDKTPLAFLGLDETSWHANVWRWLQTTDGSDNFDEFNQLFQNAQIQLPDTEVSKSGLTLTLKNLYCKDISVQDITTSNELVTDPSTSDETEVISVVIGPFALNCYSDYSYKYSFFRGSGQLEAYSSNNQVQVALALTNAAGGGFAAGPPTNSSITSCQTSINVSNLNFSGGLVASFLDLIENLIKGTIEDQVNNAICPQLARLPSTLDKLLEKVQGMLENYLQPIPANYSDPLFLERTLVPPSNGTLLTFQGHENTTWGDLTNTVVDKLDQWLGKTVPDTTHSNLTDLQINVLLRKLLLDQDGALTLNVSNLPGDIEFDPVIYQGEDRLTNSTISIDSVKLIGLDTLREFQPLEVIGNHTVRNVLAWDFWEVELYMTVNIRPSSRSDSFLINPNPVNIVEPIKISFGVESINAVVAVLVAIDQGKLGSLELGSLLQSDNLWPCILSVIHQVDIAGLAVSISYLDDPVLTGFVSSGIDRVLNSLVGAGLVMYEPSFLAALPYLFEVKIRDLINSHAIDKVLSSQSNACPLATSADQYVDFRDFFLNPEDAVQLGGSGKEQYGDLAYVGFNLLEEQVLASTADGLSAINDLLVRPLTERLSSVPGVLNFPSSVLSIFKTNFSNNNAASYISNLQLEISEIRVQNLDTIGSPLVVLRPSENQPYLLDNILKMGTSSRPLQVVFRFLLAMDGPSLPAGIMNEIDVSGSIDSVDVATSIIAMVKTASLLGFPLRDMTNVNCWLSLLKSTALDGKGFAVNEQDIRGLSIESLNLNITSLALENRCILCSGPGIDVVLALQDIWEQTGALRFLQSRIPSLVSSLLKSDSLQTIIDRRVQEASLSCPSSPEFSGNQAKPRFGSPGIPSLSPESVDTILYTAMLTAYSGFVVLATTLGTGQVQSADPLSTQSNFSVPQGIRLVDFTNLGNSTGLGLVADSTFSKITKLLQKRNENGDLAINSFLLGLFGNSSTLEKKFSDLVVERDDFFLSLDSLRVTGLDNITNVNLLEPIGPQTLRNSLQVDKLSVEVHVRTGFSSWSQPLQNLTLRFGFSNVAANVSLFAAIDLDKVLNTGLGLLLQTKNIFPCLLSTLYSVDLPQVLVSVGSFDAPEILGLMTDTDAAASRSLKALTEEFEDDIVEAIPGLFAGIIRQLSLQLLRSFISDPKNSCDASLSGLGSAPGLSRYLDFRDLLLTPADALKYGGSGLSPYGDTFQRIMKFASSQLLAVDNATGLSMINRAVIEPLTIRKSNSSGSIIFPGDLFNQRANIDVGGFKAKILLRAYDAYIENFDTIGDPMSLLNPVAGDPNQLLNTATIGIGKPLRFGTRFTVQLRGGDTDISNDLDMSVDFSTATFVLDALLKIPIVNILAFPLRDIINLNCWIATIPAPRLDKQGTRIDPSEVYASLVSLNTTVPYVAANVSCISCTSPLMEQLSNLLASHETTDDVNRVLSRLFSYADQLLTGEYLQNVIDRKLNEVRKRCPHCPEYQSNPSPAVYAPLELTQTTTSANFILYIVVVTGSIVVFSWLIVIATKFVVIRRHREWLSRLSTRKVLKIWQEQSRLEEKALMINSTTRSLFLSAEIPLSVRLLMPLIILGNIGFFLSGHLSLGASVTVILSLAGQSYRAENFFEFSMLKSTIEIWDAGSKELAVLLVIFSGVWPYTKQLTSLALWFLPPRTVSVKTRGSVFLWLDAFAKWSIIDIFVLVLTLAAFRVSIKSPNVSFLPSSFYQVDLLVIPKWGLYANMIAQLISQISSHFIIHYHRRVVAHANRRYEESQLIASGTMPLEEDDDEFIAGGSHVSRTGCTNSQHKLCEHAYERLHRGENDKLVARRGVNRVFAVAALGLSVLVVLGCTLPSYSLDIQGIVGILVESGQGFEQAFEQYSIFSTASLLMDQARFTGRAADFIGLGTLAALLVLSTLFVPLMETIALVYSWFGRMTPKRRYRLSVLIEILQAWQYSEVWLLSLAVASWQLSEVSTYILNDYCGALTNTLATFSFYGIIAPVDAQCFRVEPAIERAYYFMFSAAILLVAMNVFVSKASAQYSRDMDDKNWTHRHVKEIDVLKDMEELDTSEIRRKVHPTPVLFTDSFRWVLVREDLASRATPFAPADEHQSTPYPGSSDDDDSVDDPESFANDEAEP